MKKVLIILLVFVGGYYLHQKIKRISEQAVFNSTKNFSDNLEDSATPQEPEDQETPQAQLLTTEPVTAASGSDSTTAGNPPAVPEPLPPPEVKEEPKVESPPEPPTPATTPQEEQADHRVNMPDGGEVSVHEIGTNVLVSCSTKVKYCEPPAPHQPDQDVEAQTFCVTYAGNCLDVNSIQRVWKEEEVYPPVQPQDNSQYDQNGQQNPDMMNDPYHNSDPQMQVPVAPQYDPAPGEDFYNRPVDEDPQY